MHQTHPSTRRLWRTRALSLVLTLALLLGLVPGLDLDGGASAHWAESYLTQLVEWGFVRPNQVTQPDKQLTRADFMAITNRAYGYSDQGPTPFEDIQVSDWFYDDVEIAYTNKYIKGTSETTASPNDTLTRETAATILGRNMMMEESAGEILDFTDARDISFWSKGVIKSSLEHYLVGGYDDGTFRPQKSVTWGEMAAMLTRIVGTPLQEPGDYSLGGVFGNVTISSPGVTLRDSVISGDLYVTGGVGLGDIKLENVTVLGRIICSGTGEAEGGQASIILRNVIADELLIDNLQGKTVSVQADGTTEVGNVNVRTSAYIEDNTPEGLGLHNIVLDGHPIDEDDKDAEPPTLTLAGRIESVLDKTPGSFVHVGKGTVGVLTIDEAAVDSHVTIDRNAEVKELNLDTATLVDGEGDIKHLNVNAPGCEVTILPEEIYIRPGLTAEINGEEMDTTAAEESNMDPQILSGYPVAEDIAPTTISAVFATNKKGTVYWAISPITSGSVSAEDLLKPPVYGGISVAHGSVKAAKANEEVRSAVKGLTAGGSFYLSAMLVDERGVQSPVKVIAFSTPDNSKPAFCDGYPYMLTVSAQNGCQVVVMPTKSCNLYYALMPAGAKAPTEDEFRSGAVSGSLGYGVVPVTKNTESIIRVDDVTLEEQKEYVLYLWLVDADGVNKGKITSLKFTTKDETLPYFIVPPTPNKVQATSVGLTFRLSEDGTVYWAVVPAGTEYPKKQPGHTESPLPSDMWSKLSVQNGYSALKSGKVSASVDKDGTINVSGLEKEKSYDLYYVAVDKAGNYSAEIQKVTINTLDQTGPKITQTFTKYSGTDNKTNPMVDTGIVLHVTENIRADVDGAGEDLLSLYEASIDNTSSAVARKEAQDKLVLSLRSTIVLNQVTSGTGRGSQPVAVKGESGVGENWVIDYAKVTVTRKDSGIDITFPAEALQLENGSTYYFTASNLTDASAAQNPIVPNPVDFYTNADVGIAGGHDLRLFTIMLGQLYLTRFGLNTDGAESELPVKPGSANMDPGTAAEADLVPVDYSFRVIPQSTSKMEDNMCYDLLFYTDAVIDFDLYYRVRTVKEDGTESIVDLSGGEGVKYQMPNWATNAQAAGEAGWYKLGSSGILRGSKTAQAGASMGTQFNKCNQSNFPKLNKLDDSGKTYYEFAVSITQKDTSRDRNTWSGEVNLSIYAGAAPSTNLSTLTAHPTFAMWDDSTASAPATSASFLGKGLANGGGVSIGITDTGASFLKMAWPFTDKRVPSFSTESGYPKITPGDIFADISIALDRAGTIDYVIAPRQGGINATVVNHNPNAAGSTPVDKNFSADDLWDNTPRGGTQMQPGVAGSDPQEAPDVVAPEALSIAEHLFPNYIQGRVQYDGNNATVDVKVEDLMPDTDYYVYFVTSGVSTDLSPIFIYKFHTRKSAKPKIHLDPDGNANVDMTTDLESNGWYRVLTEQDARTLIDFLKAPFSAYSSYGSTGSNQLPSAYASNFTVLDAMQKRYVNSEAKMSSTNSADAYFPGEDDGSVNDYEGGYTVFDIYANDTARTKMDNLIRSGQPGLGETIPNTVSWGPSGTTSTKANWTQNILQIGSQLNSTSQYVILTMAQSKSVQQGANNALTESFSAVSFRKMSLVPPNLTDVTMINPMKPGDVANTYSGKITFMFDSNVYVRHNGSTVPITSLSNPNSLLLDGLFTGPSSGSLNVTGVVPRGFDLEFKNVEVGSTLLFQPERFLSSSGGPATEPLKMTLVRGSNNKVFVTVTWGPDEEGKDKMTTWTPLGELDVSPNNIDMRLFCTDGGSFGNSDPYYTLRMTGGTASVLANMTPQDGVYMIQWSSSDNNVVSVSATGSGINATITRHGTGEATITVRASDINGNTVSKTILVTSPGNVSFAKSGSGGGTFSNNAVTLTAGSGNDNTITLNATVDPDNPNLVIDWKKNSGSFTVTPTNKGRSATITANGTGATSGDITISAPGLPATTITVTVNAASKNPLSGMLNGGKLQAMPTTKNNSNNKTTTKNDSKLNINKR